jgi:hypothetical protein
LLWSLTIKRLVTEFETSGLRLGLPGSEALPPERVAALVAAGEAAGLPLVEVLEGHPIARF